MSIIASVVINKPARNEGWDVLKKKTNGKVTHWRRNSAIAIGENRVKYRTAE